MNDKFITPKYGINFTNGSPYTETYGGQPILKKVIIPIEICREGVTLPQYANPNDAGMDVCAAEDVLVEIGKTVLVPTGLKVAIPVGYEIQVRPRSGLSLNTPLKISNSPGTIDAGYRSEIGIIVTNASSHYEDCDVDTYDLSSKGNKFGDYQIKKGDRIAQLVLQKVPQMNFQIVDSVADIGQDRKGGFGSSGV